MTPIQKIAGAAGAVAALTIGAMAVTSSDTSSSPEAAPMAVDALPVFTADFSSPGDFYNRFDMGYSGIGPFVSGLGPTHFHGDHDPNCGDPTTSRDVAFTGTQTNVGFDQLFWYCAPGNDPSKGHVMTGVDTLGYNMAWFSPKPAFTGIQKVCWDINETTMSARKWTQVVFVGNADATRYPTGTVTADGNSNARGTGGFDMGYTAPDFRQNAPNTGIFPQGGTLAGARINFGIIDWFQNQDTFTALGVGWPGLLPQHNGGPITDKAARYTHCIENQPDGTIKFTQATPSGVRTSVFTGQIPQDARRVVFQDDNYDPPKGDFYSPTVVTWHWDNIQVFTTDSVPPPSTTQPTTTTTQPPTSSSTSTTTPSTTTTASTTTTTPTTTSSTTSTLPTTTTTQPGPIPACPSTFSAAERRWCQAVMAHIAALETAS